MDCIKFYINHQIIKYSTITNDSIKDICNKTLELDKIPTYQKRLVSSNNNLVIKFIQYDINNLNNEKCNNIDSEIFLINQYLENKFTHPSFLPYIAITNIINFGRKILDNSEISEINMNKSKVVQDEYITLVTPMNIGIIMPKYKPFEMYLFENQDLDHILVLNNIYNILDLAILIRDKYNMIHCDVKLENILVNNNIFYLIDWENTFQVDEKYYHEDRSSSGNTEMYPHYDVNSEEFFVYSIGVLITRIIGFHYGVTCFDFIENLLLNYVLSKIPNNILRHYDDLLIHIFVVKIHKIEDLKDKISKIINNK
jgi:hypothetical protein